ncbi:tetratricopeptide repeat protein [Aestuariibaculum sediminum]|uniref:Tetratricopeptide repeat protein n=1 Tax=Aestuariibaculum sediminum TaxID=2770637 RepID=A0A8J6U9G5_9FLAO|nr:hypothetical protein [Aestuariibaculum sediminum]MBD0833162.1 hypothetical protein [Aestuariibaculum sediminum]
MTPQNFKLAIIVFLSFHLISFSQTSRTGRKAQQIKDSNHLFNNAENDSLVVDLGYSIEEAINSSDVNAFMEHFDKNHFINTAITSVKTPESQENYKQDFAKSIKSKLTFLPEKIMSEVENGGYYNFLNYGYYSDVQTYYMLFRLYTPESGVNYHEYTIAKKDNELVFNDIYVFLSGETLTKTFNKLFLYSLPKESLLNIFDDATTKNFIKLADGVNKYNNQDYANAYKTLNSIEGELGNDKYLLIIKSMCASKIGNEEYKAATKQIIDQYPNDPTLYLTQIDYHILNKSYDQALNLLEKLQSDTEDDFLNLMKGNIELERENYSAALPLYKFISDNYADFFQGHASYLVCLALLQDYDTCASFLNQLIEDGYDKNEMIDFIESLDEEGQNELSGLVQSNPYKTWKKES